MPHGKTQVVELPLSGVIGPYGDSIVNQTRPNSYHSTMHGLVSHRGFVPFVKATEIDFGTDLAEYMAPIEWTTAAAGGGDPIILLIGGANTAFSTGIKPDGTRSVEEIFAASRTIDPDFASLAAALHSDGATAERLYAAFGDTGTIMYRNIAAVGSETWTAKSGGSPLQANGVFAADGILWALAGDADATDPSHYEMRAFDLSADPGGSTTANAPINVGDASSPIRGIALAARKQMIVVKTDGIYVFDSDTQKFEKLWDLSDNKHNETGKGTKAWGADVFVPLGWGGMVRVTRDLNVLPVSPIPPNSSPDDTTPGQTVVRALAGDAQYLWAAVKPFWRRTLTNVEVQSSTDDTNYTDRTSAVTDDDLSTSFALSVVEGANTGSIVVGHPDRFYAPWFDCSGVDESKFGGTADTISMDYWNGSWTAVSNTRDYTDGFSRPGAILPAAPIPSDWVSAQPDPELTAGYWVRFRETDDSAVINASTIREVRVIPERTALDGNNVTLTGMDEMGCRTHILRGYPVGNRLHWDDIASLHGDFSLGLIFSAIKASGEGRSLFCIGPGGIKHMQIGSTSAPTSKSFPDATNAFASLLRFAAENRKDDRTLAPDEIKGCEYVELQGRNFSNDADEVQAWVSWDGGTPVYYGSSKHLPTRLTLPTANTSRGYEYAVTIGLKDAAVNETLPEITRVRTGIYTVEEGPLQV
jgi:hypothetical protein